MGEAQQMQHASIAQPDIPSDDKPQTLYDLIGGWEAVRKAVDILYEKLLSDGNCRQFFEQTDIRKLKSHQVKFISFALGSTTQYRGKSMIEAHENLKGLDMSHFKAVEQYLKEALQELGVHKDIIGQAMGRVEDVRPQFEEAVKRSRAGEKSQESIYKRIGGWPAAKAAVELLYERLLSDGNCRQFFENTDLRRLKAHQAQFIKFALGGSDSYTGKDMVTAHKRLKGLQMNHFEAVARHLAESLRELSVSQALIDEVTAKVGSLRPQFEKACEVANS